MTLCTICGREALKGDGFCRYHQEALDNIHSSYENWRKASGVSWREYIVVLCEIDETGRWVREVAEQIKSQSDPSKET